MNCVAITLGPGLLAPIVAAAAFGCLLARAVIHRTMWQRFRHHMLDNHGGGGGNLDHGADNVESSGDAEAADGLDGNSTDDDDRSLPVDCVALLLGCMTAYIATFMGNFYGFAYSAAAICLANWAGFAVAIHFVRQEQHPRPCRRARQPAHLKAGRPTELLMEQLLPAEEA